MTDQGIFSETRRQFGTSSQSRISSSPTRLTHSIESILSSSGSVQHKRKGTQQSVTEEAEGSNELEPEKEPADRETAREEQTAHFGGTKGTSVFQKKN